MHSYFGVWWRVFVESGFVEDMPYCPCCEPHQKLVQTEWYPEEKYVCPRSKTEIQLYDRVPVHRVDVVRKLREAHDQNRGDDLYEFLHNDFRRRKELNPEAKDEQLLAEMIDVAPLARMREADLQKILRIHPQPYDFFRFLRNHYNAYRKDLEDRGRGAASLLRRLTRKGRRLARFTLPQPKLSKADGIDVATQQTLPIPSASKLALPAGEQPLNKDEPGSAA